MTAAKTRSKRQFQCIACGYTTLQWSGQCGGCGAWNTLEETVIENNPRASVTSKPGVPKQLSEVAAEEEIRTPTGIGELDRVLGGGLVAGSVTLLGGDPGIGKSTLLIQALANLGDQLRCLYISGEESLQQVSMRARRLGLNAPALQLLAETSVERILATAESEKPQVMVIDSIQTVFTDRLTSAPGSVAQVRESAAQLVRFAKQSDTALWFVGHVTKEGTLAGPRVLEHMVDTVLYFEGEAGNRYRLIRTVKNRFGAANELGVFAMTEQGLRPVNNPSAIFLSRHEQPVPGSIVLVTREGTRPLLVEVQALVDTSHVSNPRRVTLGLEQNRLSMLLAVMHRHAGLALFDQDVYVNVVGGVRITETAADLAVIMAAISSFRNRPLDIETVTFGEIGLAGEIRPVPNGQERLQEAAKHGFKRAIVPQANAPKKGQKTEIEIIPVQRVGEILDLC
jgi:DNA repair protein RadA/Sms